MNERHFPGPMIRLKTLTHMDMTRTMVETFQDDTRDVTRPISFLLKSAVNTNGAHYSFVYILCWAIMIIK